MTSLEIDPDLVLWSAEPDARDRPLVILMHGRGSDERDLAALVPSLPADFVYAALRAPLDSGTGYAWYPSDPARPGDPVAGNVDAAADAVLAWLAGLDRVPPRVGALGFSQGGAMSIHLLRRGPAVSFALDLAGVVVEGVQDGDARLAVERPPVYWGRGALDGLFTPALIERAEAWLPAHTAPETVVYPDLGHSVSDEMLRDVIAFLEARR